MNVSGLDWQPFLVVEENTVPGPGGDGVHTRFLGPDGLLLTTIANTYNFTLHFSRTSNWVEVKLIIYRKIFFIDR